MSEAGAEVQPAEAPSMAEESSTEEETSMSDPSVSAFLTKQLCKHGGRLPLSDIPQHLDLTPEHIASILREEGKRFPQPEPGTVFAQSPIRLCGGYLGGKCESTQCERLHLCRYFILGRCFIGRNRHGKFCKFSHHIRSIENRAVLKTHEISNLNEKELRVLLQLNDPYCLPEVCREYQGHKNATCPKGNECHRLHVCQYFARGQCRYYRCNRSHDLLDPDAIKVLNVRGLSDEMINNVQLLRIHQCNEARKEPGKQEQPKRWKSKGEDISVACHDMHQSDTCDVQELGDRSPSPSNAGGTKSARSAPQRRGKPHLGNSGRPRFTKAASVYPKAKYHDEVQPIETREVQKSGTPTIPPSSSSTAAPRTRIRQTDNQGVKESVDPGENTPTMNTLKYAKDELFGQKPPVSWTQWADKLDEIMSVSSPPSIKTMDAKCPSTQSTNNVDVQASMRSPPPLTANNMMSNRTTPKADGQPTNKPVVPTLLDDSPTLPTFNKCKSPGLFGSSEDDVKPPAHTLVDSSPMPRSKKCTAAAPLAISPGDSEQVVRASVERSPPMPTYKSCFATTTFATEDNTKHDIRTSVDASTSNSAVQTLVGASPSLTTYTKDTTAGLRTCSIGDTKRAAGTSLPIPTVYNTNPGEVTHIGTASSMQASAKRPATPIPTVYNTNPGAVTHIGTASSMQASVNRPATPIPIVYNTNTGAVTHIGTASSMQASVNRPATPIPTVYNTNPGAVTHIGTASSMQTSANRPASPTPTNKIRFIPNRPHSVTIQPANRPNGPSTVGLSPTSPSTTFTANLGMASQTRRDEGHFVPHHAPHRRVNEIHPSEMEDFSPPLPRRNVSRSHVPPVRSPPENRGDPNEICFNNLWKFCKDQQNCPQMHYYLPYRWQRQKGAGEWEDLPWMEDIEKAYSDPDNTSSGKHDINFEKMISCYLPIRRLSTASSVTQPPDHLMTTEWVWHWKNELGKWIEYGKHGGKEKATIASADLETIYLADKSSVVPFQAGAQLYQISFKDMIQKNLVYSTEKEVRRRPRFVSKEDVDKVKASARSNPVASQPSSSVQHVPVYWDRTSLPDLGYKPVNIANNSVEFQEIEKSFKLTMSGYTIKGIQRIQNITLWKFYQMQMEVMKKQSRKDVLEKKLFHGTNVVHVPAICQNNFDWRICGFNGTVYGKGSYFARDASYSHNYCQSDSSSKTMFLARILVGEFTKGLPQYNRPPAKVSGQNTFYDSCVDKEHDPSIFVVFEKHQIYPEYIVEYAETKSCCIS